MRPSADVRINRDTHYAQHMARRAAHDNGLLQIVVPKTYHELTTRRVLTAEWIEGEKLSQSAASDVGTLVQIGALQRRQCNSESAIDE